MTQVEIEKLILENGFELEDEEGNKSYEYGTGDIFRISQLLVKTLTIPAVRLSCPCNHLEEPCKPNCTCVDLFSSAGCDYCATYGSKEQQKSMSEYLADKLKRK